MTGNLVPIKVTVQSSFFLTVISVSYFFQQVLSQQPGQRYLFQGDGVFKVFRGEVGQQDGMGKMVFETAQQLRSRLLTTGTWMTNKNDLTGRTEFRMD